MNIGSKIQELRKINKFTQEQLADAVGVSIPAVSKWENGASFPDVTLLSPIARFLRTDLNDLLDFEENLSKKEVDFYIDSLRSTFESEGFESGVEASYKLAKEYPSSNLLKVNLVTLIRFYGNLNNQAIDKNNPPEYIEVCIDWLLHVHTYPNENDHPIVEAGCLSLLCMLYKDIGQLEKMESLINIPESSHDPTLLLSQVYLMQDKLDEAENLFKNKVFNHLFSTISDIMGLCRIHIKRMSYDKAHSYAEDFYTITSRISIIHFIPSSLLLEVYLAKGDLEMAYKSLLACFKELEVSSEQLLPERYLKTNKYEKIEVWSTTLDDDTREIFLKQLKDNPNSVEFLKRPDVKLIIEQMSKE